MKCPMCGADPLKQPKYYASCVACYVAQYDQQQTESRKNLPA